MRLKIITLILATVIFSGCAINKSTTVGADVGNLENHIKYITNEIGIRVVGTEKENTCANYVIDELNKYGYSTANQNFEIQEFTANGNKSKNIIAKINGNKDKIISVVAHYDSMPETHGAKDNASGTAGLLEIARILSKAKVSDYEVRLIFLGSEENGYHGSAYYVNNLTEDEKTRHIAVYNMDISIASKGDGFIPVCTTLGGRDENGNYIDGDIFSPVHNAVSKSIEQAFWELGYYEKSDEGESYKAYFHYGESDHVSFSNGKIDSANVCWRKVTTDYAELPPEYHKMTDLTDNLDYTSLEKTVNAIVKAIEIVSA